MASEPATTSAIFRADLHVHSYRSAGPGGLHWFRARDCYSPPPEVYRRAKERGMSLVTITDHDTIRGCLELLDRALDLPDFIIGEEVTTYLPGDPHAMHVGVYGLNEAQHQEIQRLRWNVVDLAAYLRSTELFFALNHPFFRFGRTRRLREFFERVLGLFPAFEVQNGAMHREYNELVARIVDLLGHAGKRLGRVAGSDAHTLRRVGTTYTASHAQSKEEFLADLRAGRTFAAGRHGGHGAIAGDAYGVALRYLANLAWDRLGDYRRGERIGTVALVAALGPLAAAPLFVALGQTYEQRRLAGHVSAALAGADGDSSSALLAALLRSGEAGKAGD